MRRRSDAVSKREWVTEQFYSGHARVREIWSSLSGWRASKKSLSGLSLKTALLAVGAGVGVSGMVPSAQARTLPLGIEPVMVQKGPGIASPPSMLSPSGSDSFLVLEKRTVVPPSPAAMVVPDSTAGVDFLEAFDPWRVVGRGSGKANVKASVSPRSAQGSVTLAPLLQMPAQRLFDQRYGFEGSGANAIVNRTKLQAILGGNGALIEAQMEEVEWTGLRAGNGKSVAGHRVRLNFGGPVSIEIDQAAVDALVGEGGLISADGERIAMDAHVADGAAFLAINHTASRPARAMTLGKNGEIHLLAERDSSPMSHANPVSRAAAKVSASQLPPRAQGLVSR